MITVVVPATVVDRVRMDRAPRHAAWSLMVRSRVFSRISAGRVCVGGTAVVYISLHSASIDRGHRRVWERRERGEFGCEEGSIDCASPLGIECLDLW